MEPELDIISMELIPFVGRLEGKVLRAYRDPVGILTIGYGFTMRSEIFASWARRKWNHDLQMGDTITEAEANYLLAEMLDKEYAPYVKRAMQRAFKQHETNGSTSVVFNLGPRATGWKWFEALNANQVHTAATRLKSTGTTAQGVPLAGLVKRRKYEADLIEFGKYDYSGAPVADTSENIRIRTYQEQLKYLDYYDGEIDGVHGPKTDAAVRKFQGDYDLTVDGVVGRATSASLERAVNAKRDASITAGGGVGGGAAGGAGSASDGAQGLDAVLWAVAGVLAVAAALFIGFWLWRNRKGILAWAELRLPFIKPLTRKLFPPKSGG